MNIEDKFLVCEVGFDILSLKQLEDFLIDKFGRFVVLSCGSVMEEMIIGFEIFRDMVYIDLNEEEECVVQVFKNVFEKFFCGLSGLQEYEDVEIKFYISKLGRVIYYFRLVLQGVFQKSENSGSISFEDL